MHACIGDALSRCFLTPNSWQKHTTAAAVRLNSPPPAVLVLLQQTCAPIPSTAAAASAAAVAAAAGSRVKRLTCCMASSSPLPAPTAAPQGTTEPPPLVLVVAIVLLNEEGQVLLAQRPPGKKLAGLWEFPGGKVDPGESPETALVRELQEELEIQVAPAALSPLTFASHAYPSFHLLMPTYVASEWEGQPTGAEGQELAWVSTQELEGGRYEMPPADIPLLPSVLAAMQQHREAMTAGTAQ